MGAFDPNQAGVPTVKLVMVRPEEAKAEAPVITTVGNLRQQRIEQFLDLKDLASRTRKTYAQQLRWFSDWVDKDWQTIHLNDVRRYKLHLEQERQLKPNSVALALSSLKSFYAWLKLAGYVVENPMVAVSVPRPAAAESQNLEGFQVDALVKALESRGETVARDAAIVCLLFFAGLRANEVSGLNVGDYNGVEVIIKEAKHDSTGRVPVNRQTDEAIREYLMERWVQSQGALSESDPMFVSHSPKSLGQRLGYQGIYYMVKDLAASAGLENIHPHRGRHTFASRLIEDGMDAYLAMQLTRHRSVQAFKTYSNKVRYQAAKTAYWKGQGEKGREAQSLVELVAGAEVPGDEDLIAEEPAASPQATAMEDSPKGTQIGLKFKVMDELKLGRNRAKVRREIEEQVLGRFQVVKPKKGGGEYRLAIPDGDLEAAIEEIRWEMDLLAELEECTLEVVWS